MNGTQQRITTKKTVKRHCVLMTGQCQFHFVNCLQMTIVTTSVPFKRQRNRSGSGQGEASLEIPQRKFVYVTVTADKGIASSNAYTTPIMEITLDPHLKYKLFSPKQSLCTNVPQFIRKT